MMMMMMLVVVCGTKDTLLSRPREYRSRSEMVRRGCRGWLVRGVAITQSRNYAQEKQWKNGNQTFPMQTDRSGGKGRGEGGAGASHPAYFSVEVHVVTTTLREGVNEDDGGGEVAKGC